MKVNIYRTELVSDEQRDQIANLIDQKVSKRAATREEMKDFIWSWGARWPRELAVQHAELVGVPEDSEPDDAEDLLGDPSADDGDLLGEPDEPTADDLL